MSTEGIVALILDDMAVARIRMKNVCLKCGIKQENIVEAANGREAWEKMSVNNVIPNIILSDYNMPDMNGLDFLDLVRKNDATKAIPVIFVTAESQKNFLVSAISTGVTDVVIKPYADATLINKMKEILT